LCSDDDLSGLSEQKRSLLFSDSCFIGFAAQICAFLCWKRTKLGGKFAENMSETEVGGL
jgi:hypothetical protein